jgi:ATP-binding cassette subfamily C protein
MVNFIIVECVRLGAAFFAILQLTVAATILCIYVTIAILVSGKVMLYMVAAGLILFTIVRPIRSATRRYGKALGPINAEMAGTINEMVAGAKLIKATAGQDKASALMGAQIDRLRANATWSAFLPSTIRSVFEFGAILTVLGALVYGMKVEQASPAQLLLIIALIARLFPRLLQVQVFHNLLNLTAPSYAIVRGAHERFAARREDVRAAAIGAIDPGHILPADITARDITIRYGEYTALDRVSFRIPVGQVVGFVGPSGAGKTTLIDTVLGLVVPAEGEVKIGEVALRDLDLRAWRHKVGYVSQETFLFHDTIANNIRWNAPDIPMKEVESAAHAAGLESFIANLPAGYDTIVGERGAKLSGGQRQRVSIARALVRQPALLVLDEATSALDSLSEQDMMAMLDTLRGKMAIAIVAHRFSTVRNADFIYVLDEGRIVEQGTWDALSGQKALFHRLMQAQAVGERG